MCRGQRRKCVKYAENALLEAGRVFSQESREGTTFEMGSHWRRVSRQGPLPGHAHPKTQTPALSCKSLGKPPSPSFPGP